jgi:hypothetical protein
METFEEVPDALKELKEGIIARAYSIGRLRLLRYQTLVNKEGTHSEENIDSDED